MSLKNGLVTKKDIHNFQHKEHIHFYLARDFKTSGNLIFHNSAIGLLHEDEWNEIFNKHGLNIISISDPTEKQKVNFSAKIVKVRYKKKERLIDAAIRLGYLNKEKI